MSPNDSLISTDVGYILAKPGKTYITSTNSYSSGIGLQGMQSGPVLRESPVAELLLI
jgi:hypothetical protein